MSSQQSIAEPLFSGSQTPDLSPTALNSPRFAPRYSCWGLTLTQLRATCSLNAEVFIFCSSWLRLADGTKVSLAVCNPCVTVLWPSLDAMQLTSPYSMRCRAFIPLFCFANISSDSDTTEVICSHLKTG